MPDPITDVSTDERLQEFKRKIEEQYPFFIGFPGSVDFDYRHLYPFFDYLLNNVGDPYVDPLHANHSKSMEKEVIEFFADLFRAPKSDRWGYVTGGGTEGNLYALYVARELYKDAILYYSDAAHYSVPKNAYILGLPTVVVPSQQSGEIDYEAFSKAVAENPGRPAIVVASIGTTMTEARDDVSKLKTILRKARVNHFIHSDAALAGTYTALIEPRHRFDFKDGADSVSISGHKFIGSPMSCGLVVVRLKHRELVRRSATYVGSPDTTISGSRNGHTPLFLWYAINKWGRAGFLKRAMNSLELAEYTEKQLKLMGWHAWRNPNAITVMLESPPRQLVHKWQLATFNGWSHVICMPGVTKERIDRFLADLRPLAAKTKVKKAAPKTKVKAKAKG